MTPMPTGRRSRLRELWHAFRQKKNRLQAFTYDYHLYKERNMIERFFGKIKQFRRVATRYDKKAANFLGFVWIASLTIILA